MKGWYGDRQKHSMASRGIKLSELRIGNKSGEGMHFNNVFSNRKYKEILNTVLDNGIFVNDYMIDESQTVSNAGVQEVYDLGKYVAYVTMWNKRAEEHKDGQIDLSIEVK